MYANGEVPLAALVHLGGNHWLPPGTAARWLWVVAEGKRRYGVTLRITPDRDGLGGWNAYRPKSAQILYRKRYGIGAAVAGYSTHGGKVGGREVFAIDVDNWAVIGWAAFSALCREAGFTVNFVTPQELWHIGDYNNPWVVPAFTGGSTAPAPAPTPKPIGDQPMYIKAISDGAWARKGVIYTNDTGGHWRGMSNLEGNGYVIPLVNQGKLPYAEFYGTDLDLLFALNGVWEQRTIDTATAPRWGGGAGTPLMGLGVTPGKLIYPGSTDWHYPIAQTPPGVKVADEVGS